MHSVDMAQVPRVQQSRYCDGEESHKKLNVSLLGGELPTARKWVITCYNPSDLHGISMISRVNPLITGVK